MVMSRTVINALIHLLGAVYLAALLTVEGPLDGEPGPALPSHMRSR